MGSSRARRVLAALVAVAALTVAAVGGVVLGASSGAVQEALVDLRGGFRQALGLPKFWEPAPTPDLSGREVRPCPADALVFVTGGQSNAANSNSALSAAAPDAGVFDFHDGACFVSRDPVPGATGVRGSLWPEFGARAAARLERPVVFVHGAVGGTQVSDWLDPRSGYLDRLLAAIAAAQAAGLSPDWILWHQGETDAKVLDDPAPFERDMTALADRLLAAAPEARLYLFRASRCVGAKRARGVPMITEAQTRVAEAHPRIVPGVDTDAFGDDFRHDRCHLNSLGRAAVIDALDADLLSRIAAGPAGGKG